MILNVDDDAAGRYAKSRILKKAGYEVVEAGTGAEALKLVKEFKPELVLLDVKLPDITGLEVCRRIKEDSQSSHVMVLQISASFVTVPDRVLGLDCGADTYLTEPVESTELLATVRALLRLYEREQENRELLAKLRDMDQQKDDFLAMLAHELRNPLHPIRGAIEVLQNAQLDADSQLCREVIDQQTQHLSRLIDDLLDVARITRDKLELRKERISLAQAIRGAVESSRAFFESHKHRAIVTLPPESAQLEADPVRLTQILVNLLNNAAKYTPAGGSIWISGMVAGDRAALIVKDTGIGIAADQLPHVFDKFYQADRSLERSDFGLGLGLTLTRRLVELHDGTIEARSDGLGRGSEFLITLPLTGGGEEATPTAGQPAISAGGGDQKWRVLIVDDGARTRQMYSMLLGKRGHQVETAPDGETAIGMVESFRPDIVLLDVGMPRLNGFDTCARMRALPGGKDIALIAVTGWAQYEVQQRADESGFDAILVKPAGVQQIIELADSLMKRKELLRQGGAIKTEAPAP